MEYALEVHDLKKKYGHNTVLDGLNMHIPKGAIYGLIGKNGAGKTTLMRILAGMQRADEGGYSFYGVENFSRDFHEIKKTLGAIIERPAVYEELSAIDNMRHHLLSLGLTENERLSEMLDLVGLKSNTKKLVRNFSYGMKARLAIAMALVGNPDFLILDEPTNGLDPEGIVEIRKLIMYLHETKNMTIMISSHNLDELARLATHYGLLDKKTIIEEISKEELEKNLETRIELKVEDPSAYAVYFDGENISYKVLSDDSLYVYTKKSLPALLRCLRENDLNPKEARVENESLEDYYLRLLGGEKR